MSVAWGMHHGQFEDQSAQQKSHNSPVKLESWASESGLEFVKKKTWITILRHVKSPSRTSFMKIAGFFCWTSVTSSARSESRRTPFICDRTKAFAADKSAEMM